MSSRNEVDDMDPFVQARADLVARYDQWVDACARNNIPRRAAAGFALQMLDVDALRFVIEARRADFEGQTARDMYLSYLQVTRVTGTGGVFAHPPGVDMREYDEDYDDWRSAEARPAPGVLATARPNEYLEYLRVPAFALLVTCIIGAFYL